MDREYELLYMNKAKHGDTVFASEENFYNIELREKVLDNDIPNNKSDDEILDEITNKHTKDWVKELPTVKRVQVKSKLSDLEHPQELETGDCIKIGDNIWFLTTNGWKLPPEA